MAGLTIPKSIGADLPALPFSNTGSIQDFRTKQSEAERQASEASRKATAAGEREAQLRQAKSAEYEPVMEKIGKRIEEEQAKSVPSLEAIPEYQKTQISPEQTKEAFSTFMAFAMLGGALTRQPMLAAMNNMTAAMKGWQEGDTARTKAELESFDRNFKVAQAKRTGQIEERKAAHEKYKGDLEGLMNAEKQIALKYEDQIAAELTRKGDFNALAKHYDALAKNYETAIHHANQVEQQNRRLAEQEKRDQQRHQEVMAKIGGKEKQADAKPSDDADSLAKAVANYSLAPPAPRAKNRDAIMAKVLQINPNYQESDYKNREIALRNWTNPNGSGFKQLSAFGQLPLHLQTLQELGDAMQNNDVRLLNKVVNTVQTQLGHPEATNFETVKTAVGTEFTKAIAGTAATGKEREEAQNLFSAAKSPEQLKGAIEQAKTLVGGRLSVLKQQYEAGTGRKDFEKLLPEGAQETFKNYVPTSQKKQPTEADKKFARENPKYKQKFIDTFGVEP